LGSAFLVVDLAVDLVVDLEGVLFLAVDLAAVLFLAELFVVVEVFFVEAAFLAAMADPPDDP